MLLLCTAVEAEAQAVASLAGTQVIVSGVGRTNAAAAVTQAILEVGVDTLDGVLGIGVAGALPGSLLTIGDVVYGSSSVYMEEGIEVPEGFQDMQSMGFPLGDFDGNSIMPDAVLARAAAPHLKGVCIATVATCSGTDAAADRVVDRTGACAEAMEGAAVLHAAGRLGVAALEIRAISNTTGDRAAQQWDLRGALDALQFKLPAVLASLSEHAC
jgi:futalosine hydrolase